MKEARILGNNIKVLLQKMKIDINKFAQTLGYSCEDVDKLCEGRLYSDNEDIQDIANYFGISVADLLERKTDDEYNLAGCVHYNHTFKEEKNQDEIFDLFDIVCDIKEVL
jgi:transcriptional regulator with XRE-family HTH domain